MNPPTQSVQSLRNISMVSNWLIFFITALSYPYGKKLKTHIGNWDEAPSVISTLISIINMEVGINVEGVQKMENHKNMDVGILQLESSAFVFSWDIGQNILLLQLSSNLNRFCVLEEKVILWRVFFCRGWNFSKSVIIREMRVPYG